MKVAEEEECLLNKFKEMINLLLSENGQKAQLTYFNWEWVIMSKETVKLRVEDQDPPHQASIFTRILVKLKRASTEEQVLAPISEDPKIPMSVMQ